MFDSGIILWEKLDASQFVSVINDLPIAKKTPQKIENTISFTYYAKRNHECSRKSNINNRM